MPSTPAPIIVGKVMECIVKGTMTAGGSNSTPCGNVFYYRLSNQVLAPTKAAFSTIFQATVLVPLLAAANIAYAPNSLLLRFLDDATDVPLSVAAAGVGAIGTDSEPSNDAVVCYMRSAFRGKVFRGFKHFGATNEVDTLRDVLVGAGLVRWQAVRDSLKIALVDALGNTWTHIVFSRFMSQVIVNPTVVRGSDITISLLDLTIGTMRRRKAKTVR